MMWRVVRQVAWAWTPRPIYLWRLRRHRNRSALALYADRALVESQIRAARMWRYPGR